MCIKISRQLLEGLFPAARCQMGRLTVLDCVDSTNTWLAQHGDCGDVCLAERQSAGRGRAGRQWSSPQENIYLSICYCFNPALRNPSLLGLSVAACLCEVLAKVGIHQHGIKWPNDILWQGRKLAGILIEHRHPKPHFIIGIGLNVNMLSNAHIEQPWCSLRQILQQRVNRNALLALLLPHLFSDLQNFPQRNNLQWQQAWQRWDILAGKTIGLTHAHQFYQGVADGIDPQGRLRLLVEGKPQFFTAADIHLKALIL
jgi:BirA family biotin operon repressor/biotin-[acetyl-CoA-carboxylase] ligase